MTQFVANQYSVTALMQSIGSVVLLGTMIAAVAGTFAVFFIRLARLR